MQDDRSGAPLPAAQLQSAEVLVQVASLASLRLLSPVRPGLAWLQLHLVLIQGARKSLHVHESSILLEDAAAA